MMDYETAGEVFVIVYSLTLSPSLFLARRKRSAGNLSLRTSLSSRRQGEEKRKTAAGTKKSSVF